MKGPSKKIPLSAASMGRQSIGAYPIEAMSHKSNEKIGNTGGSVRVN